MGISRLARKPIVFPADIEVTLKDDVITAKNKAGVSQQFSLDSAV